MKVTNLTNNYQAFRVREITGDRREYDMSLHPHGSTDLIRMTVMSPEKYAGILAIEGMTEMPTPVEIKSEESPAELPTQDIDPKNTEDNEESKEEESKEEESKEEESKEESPADESAEIFKCEICGAEFGSARGLKTHMNKSHGE